MEEDIKIQYCRLLMLNSDLSDNHKAYINGFEGMINLAKNIRSNTLNLYLLSEILKDISIYIRENKYLILKRKELSSDLEFMNHLRNIISGHLDNRTIRNAIQWESSVFHLTVSHDINCQLNMFYKSLIECSINSYVDISGKHKVFKGEIDLFYPPNQKELFDYLEKVNSQALNFIECILDEIKPQIKFVKNDEFLKLALEAGKVDFDIKNK
ncbi:hypothetical protein E2605_03215 [Dysgonomonas capnocytophagoides]|uniref:Uncharacterized protein n=1 Tax=Dysgonomonas capnocytophagoides TaxID=45254 RepID=A0A4Y8LAC5_9BACT|nr:hypothetical protein [Dysgonomonas capnocytophagoides]TFD99104.1 hypothetical protein E2605_03215 [Dysgonomonas capnocytophagoides]